MTISLERMKMNAKIEKERKKKVEIGVKKLRHLLFGSKSL
jgi:hypothetical protein